MNFTPEQEAAITGDAPRLCVDAGAGSGKTRVLVERIVHLVEKRGVSLEQIAAITFTDKAAAEMKARLRETFRRRARAASDDPERTTYWRSLEQRVDTARICTIHSFCTGFLREYALHIGLDPDFGVLGDAEAALLLSQTVRLTVIGLLEQQDAYALHLVAEYGTQTLRDTLGYMLRQGPLMSAAFSLHDYSTPESLYDCWAGALTLELLHLVRGEAIDPLLASLRRYEGVCDSESDGREALRVKMIFILCELRGNKDLARVKKLLRDLDFSRVSGRKANWINEAAYEGISAAQKRVREWACEILALLPLPEVDLPAAYSACALHVVYGRTASAWADAKRQANALDFDALIEMTMRFLRENTAVRADAASALRHLLVDEFQDTDNAQLEIARLLCGEPDGPHFFFVGDPKQSIYNFRGAEVELFGEQRAASAGQVTLGDNFRSLPGVLNFVNAFFDGTKLLRAVGDYPAMHGGRKTVAEDPLSSRVELLMIPAFDAEGAPRRAEEFRREEARWIAARISAMCAPGAPACIHDDASRTWRVPRFGDFALLFRATSNLYIYEEALRAAGVDFISSAGAGFYRRQEVLDVVNVLRVVTAPGDAAALAAFLRGPMGGLSDDALLLLAEKMGLEDAFAAGDMPEGLLAEDMVVLSAARALVAELRARRHFEPAALLSFLYERTGIEAMWLSHHYGLQKASNLRKLMALARDFENGSRPPLERFVRYIAEVAEHASLREGEAMMQPFGGGAVSLMTIHKSKGLQFPVVFVCDMAMPPRRDNEKPLFAHRGLGVALRTTDESGETLRPAMTRAIALRRQENEAAESARLLYVAMTRAQDYLFLSGHDAPRGDTWFSAVADLTGAAQAANGEMLGNGDWQAHVTREVTREKACHGGHGQGRDVAETLARLEQESRLSPTPLYSISVSSLLDRMTQLGDEEDERANDLDAGEEAPLQTNTRGLTRGSIVHRLFELWDFHGAPPIAAALDGAALGSRARQELALDLAALAERFVALPIHAQFAGHAADREVPFVLRLGESLLHGTIDTLVGGTLVDFKTGRLDEAKHARYRMQMQLYAAALGQLNAAPTSAVLVYVDVPREEPVDISAEAVAAVLERARQAL